MQKLRRLAARIETIAFELKGGLSDRPHVEHALGAVLFVTETVMSPRMFKTGILLARAVRLRCSERTRILDLGSGSGIVGVVAARAGAKVIAIDKNPYAVRATRVSAMLSRVSIDARLGDLFSVIDRGTDDPLDVIAFNPPFFAREVGGPLDLALSGGRGLDTFARFLKDAREYLAPEGVILVAGSTAGALGKMRALYERHGYRWRTVLAKERISERLVIDELSG